MAIPNALRIAKGKNPRYSHPNKVPNVQIGVNIKQKGICSYLTFLHELQILHLYCQMTAMLSQFHSYAFLFEKATAAITYNANSNNKRCNQHFYIRAAGHRAIPAVGICTVKQSLKSNSCKVVSRL